MVFGGDSRPQKGRTQAFQNEPLYVADSELTPLSARWITTESISKLTITAPTIRPIRWRFQASSTRRRASRRCRFRWARSILLKSLLQEDLDLQAWPGFPDSVVIHVRGFFYDHACEAAAPDVAPLEAAMSSPLSRFTLGLHIESMCKS